MKITIIAFGFALVMQILDVISTCMALEKPGAYEKNKLIKVLMDKIGVLPALIAVKVFIICLVAGCLYFLPEYRLGLTIGIGAASLYYVYVVWKNFKLAKK